MFQKSLCLKIVTQLVRMTNVITEKKNKQPSWKQFHTEKKIMQNFEISCFNLWYDHWATTYSWGNFFLHLKMINLPNDYLTINTLFCEWQAFNAGLCVAWLFSTAPCYTWVVWIAAGEKRNQLDSSINFACAWPPKEN